MTGDLVNLRRVRKSKARAAAETTAAANRLHFGRTRSERETVAKERARDESRLDAHRRETQRDTGAAPGETDAT